MTSEIIAGWLAASLVTRVWADRDQSKEGRDPRGQRYGRQLPRMIQATRRDAEAEHALTLALLVQPSQSSLVIRGEVSDV